MEKIMRYLLAALLLITLSAFQMVHAAAPTAPLYIDDPNALVEQAKQYSGKTVVLEGEVVGDIMPRGQMYWINLLHKGLAMGVYITPSQREQLRYAGDYKNTGDVVRIKGMFHQACPDHGGDMDLHAEELQVIKTGGKRPEQAISSERVVAAVALGLPAGVCLYFLWKQRQRSR